MAKIQKQRLLAAGPLCCVLLAPSLVAPLFPIPGLADEAARRQYEGRLKSLTSENNYLGAISSQYVNFWPASRIPIKVYVLPSSGVVGYKPYYLDILKKALSQWSDASAGKISFTIVDHPAADGIEFTWGTSYDNLRHNAEGGHARIFPDADGIKKATIEVFTFPNAPDPRSTDVVVMATCLHEIGHALGLQGHSPVSGDLMCASEHVTYGATTDAIKLTERDKSTILSLLALGPRQDPDISSASDACVDLNNAAFKNINQGNFQTAIEELEKCLQIDPTYKIASDNLEVAYNNCALQLYGQKRYGETADCLTKVLNCLDKRAKPDPAKLTEVLKVYAFCLQQSGNNAEAQKAQERLDKISGAAGK